MKKILTLSASLLFICVLGMTQYNNEWIDYSKTYYKFKIAKDGLFRITLSDLQAMGFANANVEDIQLWRNGQQITLFTSVNSGVLPSNGFIEFWGEINDGKPDNILYRNPSFQLHDKWSLFTDSATYFITVKSGNNPRYTSVNNDLSGTLPSPLPYFIFTTGTYYKSRINEGAFDYIASSGTTGTYLRSSTFDEGEMWSVGILGANASISAAYNNLFVYNGSGAPATSTLKYGAAGYNQNNRSFTFYLNNIKIDSVYNSNGQVSTKSINFNSSILSNNNSLVFRNLNNANTDFSFDNRATLFFSEITYAREFNFGGNSNFNFELPASTANTYLEITNFNNSAIAPILYDLTNRIILTGDISVSGKVRILLPPSSSARKLVLVSRASANLNNIESYASKTFTNLVNNQGNYLIISHPRLFNNGSGINYVDEYRAYRSSEPGGNYNAKVYDINELIDQFAFGIKGHPIAIRNFLRFARSVFTIQPKYCLLIGKGVEYISARRNETISDLANINFVPTFGIPASDNMLSSDNSNSPIPIIPIGRINAVNGNEVRAYLDKVKVYTSSINSSSPNAVDKLWHKNIIHIVGINPINDTYNLSGLIENYLNSYKSIIEDTLTGGKVITYKKSGDVFIDSYNSDLVKEGFQNGLGLINFFGHSSTTQLEFSLDDPADLNNENKYPIFFASGCNAGNLYIYDILRTSTNLTLSEKFILTPKRGVIAFIASSSTGLTNFLDYMSREFYKEFSRSSYGKTIGEIQKTIITTSVNNIGLNNISARMHFEQLNIHGDPAIITPAFSKPDYNIEASFVKINPQFISVAETNFKLKFEIKNLGKSIKDSVPLFVSRKFPNGTDTILFNKKIKRINFSDSMELTLDIQPLRDKGQGYITITIDKDNIIPELFETNNTITKDYFIFEDELRPIFPYNYSIINNSTFSLTASIANPFSPTRTYVMEIDTTEMFNSTLKFTQTVNSSGGVVTFDHGPLRDSTVYYWRTGAPSNTGGATVWNNASFLFKTNDSTGFNQSHYFQLKKNEFSNINLDENSRNYSYGTTNAVLNVNNGFETSGYRFDAINARLDGVTVDEQGCNLESFTFYVFDGKTLTPWTNQNNGSSGLYGSQRICRNPSRKFFEFNYADSAQRRRAMEFIDLIPDGSFIVMVNTNYVFSTTRIIDSGHLKSDEARLGSGRSLYHKLKNLGFTSIDNWTSHRPTIFIVKKNDNSFSPLQALGNTSQLISLSANILRFSNNGTIQSPLFGPAKQWQKLTWRGRNLENAQTDSTLIQVYGITNSGNEALLTTIYKQNDTSLSFINASLYPYIRLKMYNADLVNTTPHQLESWKVTGKLLPEGALAPNILFTSKDTIEAGEPYSFNIAFKNISQYNFDSLKLKLTVTNANNSLQTFTLPRTKKLIAGDTVKIGYTLNNTQSFTGLNTLYLMANSDNDQPEQYLFNNFFYRNFFVKRDTYNPIMDVTFDGVHILNRDIVSSKPAIKIKLKDDSKFLPLNDTSRVNLRLTFPNGTSRTFRYNTDTLQFTPATTANAGSGNNTATVDFFPYLNQDGEYTLNVTGKDASNNNTGNIDYKISFQVINKPMISNLLNYPNPFTTSTAFVFTITGSVVPQNIRIQILTVTGKVVKEITKAELGPLHIGTNITEYKWDGTDQYGQKLANGVYLYRVITNLNGKALDKYVPEGGDLTDKYFKAGYGKMVLIR